MCCAARAAPARLTRWRGPGRHAGGHGGHARTGRLSRRDRPGVAVGHAAPPRAPSMKCTTPSCATRNRRMRPLEQPASPTRRRGSPAAGACRRVAPTDASTAPTAPKRGGFFLSDAGTNPEHIAYALKTTGAAMFCYLLYTLLDWPGIHTCVITCYIVSLGSAGETVQKLRLRLAGCVIGALAGTAASVFIVPHMDSIASLLALVSIAAALSAWIAVGPPAIAYAGFQIAFAFFLCVIQGAGPLRPDHRPRPDHWHPAGQHGGLPDLHARLAGQHRRQRRPRHDGPCARNGARSRPAARRAMPLAAEALAAGRDAQRQLSLTAYEPAWLRPPQAWQDARRDTGGAVRHGRAAGLCRRPRARRCRAAGADRRRGPGQSAIAPAGHGRRGAARLASADRRPPRAPSPARPPNPPRKPRPMPLPKMPSLSVRPSWPIPLPRLSWPALLLSLAGCATSSLDLAPPRADRPWTPPVDASGAIVPARPGPTAPTRATCCRPTPPARCRKTTPSIPATNTPWPNSSTWRNRPIRAPASPGTRRATPRWPPAWSRASTCRSWPPPP